MCKHSTVLYVEYRSQKSGHLEDQCLFEKKEVISVVSVLNNILIILPERARRGLGGCRRCVQGREKGSNLGHCCYMSRQLIIFQKFVE